MDAKTVRGILPLFPGFYHSVLEFDYVFDVEEDTYADMEALLPSAYVEKHGLPTAFIKKAATYRSENIDMNAYRDMVVRMFTLYVADLLKDVLPKRIAPKVTKSLLYSPRQYNYENDRITSDFEFPQYPKFCHHVYRVFYEGTDEQKAAWCNFLKDYFTSCSGFISFYSNDPQVWLEKTDRFQQLDCVELWAVLTTLIVIGTRMSTDALEFDFFQMFVECISSRYFYPELFDVIPTKDAREKAEYLVEHADDQTDLDTALCALLDTIGKETDNGAGE